MNVTETKTGTVFKFRWRYTAVKKKGEGGTTFENDEPSAWSTDGPESNNKNDSRREQSSTTDLPLGPKKSIDRVLIDRGESLATLVDDEITERPTKPRRIPDGEYQAQCWQGRYEWEARWEGRWEAVFYFEIDGVEVKKHVGLGSDPDNKQLPRDHGLFRLLKKLGHGMKPEVLEGLTFTVTVGTVKNRVRKRSEVEADIEVPERPEHRHYSKVRKMRFGEFEF
jgi:hypothetical protein